MLCIAVLCAAVALLGAGFARAQPVPPLGSFAAADANHDGRVTLQEFETYERARLLAAHGLLARRFRALSPQQQTARLQRRFRQLDTGSKGYLDPTDWNALSHAAGPGTARFKGARPQGLTLGAGLAEVDPGYVGYHRRLDPFPLIGYRSGRFFIDGTSAGVVAAHGDAYTFSVLLAPELLRLRASDSPALAGITSRQWSIDGGANLTFREAWGDPSVTVLHDILDRNNGTQVDVGYAFPILLGAGRRLTPGLGLKWENANLTGYYYGVTAPEALPTRPAYTPGAALNPVVRLDYLAPLSSRWQFGAGLSYTHFAHTIRDSPLIDESGSLEVLISLQYSFASGAKTPAPGPLTTPIEH